jgi:hypothetical protein
VCILWLLIFLTFWIGLELIMTKNEVLEKLSNGEIDVATAGALLAAQDRQYCLRFKVAEKGGISVYGLQRRFPVTLYPDQWQALVDHIDQLKAFIAKPETQAASKENQARAKAEKQAVA